MRLGEISQKVMMSQILAFEQSLQKLKVDYIDLYLIHAPFAVKERVGQWKALIHLQEIGKIKDIVSAIIILSI